MSSMDQVFVKAFSRRNRGAQHPSSTPGVVEPSQEPDSSENRESAQQGSLHVDQSVAKTAEVWVDPVEDQIARADEATDNVPAPHVEPIATIEPPSASTRHPKADTPQGQIADTGASTTTVDSSGTERDAADSPNAVAQRAQDAVAEASALLSQYQNAVEDTVQLSHIHTAYAGSYEELSVTAPAHVDHESAHVEHESAHVDHESAHVEHESAHVSHEVEVPAEREFTNASEDDGVGQASEGRAGTAQERSHESAAYSQEVPAVEGVEARIETPAEILPSEAVEVPPMTRQQEERAPVADTPPVPELHFEDEPETEHVLPGTPAMPPALDTDASELASPETASDPIATYLPFQAVWEVDVFDVPTPVADLFFEGALFQQIAERMSDAVGSGLKNVLITSTKPGEGRSSVAIGMAMAAAAAGIRVALVDADTESPTLADELRLDLQYGWVDVIRRGLPIKEIAVHAVEDGVTLIPLMPPGVRPAATAFEMVQLVDLLRNNFELIILDGPTSLSPGLHQCASKVDSAVIVRDINSTDTLAVSELASRLQGSGVRGVGVVENFV